MKRINDELHSRLQNAIDFHPFELQNEIIHDNHRFKTINAGRRFGKTLLGAYLVAERLLIPDSRIWIVAPTYPLTEKIWREVYSWFTTTSLAVDITKKVTTAKGSWRIETHNGSMVECKSADDPTGLIGEELDLLVIDEASRIKPIAWSEALRPTLTSRKGACVMISTPKGKNFFHQEFMKGKGVDETYRSWVAPSISNPHFPKEEWDLLKKQLGEDSPQFRQEFMAEFLDDMGAVFRNIKACIKGDFQEPVAGVRYVMGVDLAKSHDYTVCFVMREDTRHVVHMDRFNNISYDMQIPRIVELSKRYNKAKILLDSTGVGDPVFDIMKTSGAHVEPFKFTNTSKEALVRGLMIALENEEISYPQIDTLIAELEVFEYTIGSTGVFRYNAPEGFHDDCVMALALAVKACGNPSTGIIDYYKDIGKIYEQTNNHNQGDRQVFNLSNYI